MHFGNGPVLAPRNAKFGLASSRPSFQLEIIRTHFQNTARDTIGEERGQRKGKNAKAKTCTFISLSLAAFLQHFSPFFYAKPQLTEHLKEANLGSPRLATRTPDVTR